MRSRFAHLNLIFAVGDGDIISAVRVALSHCDVGSIVNGEFSSEFGITVSGDFNLGIVLNHKLIACASIYTFVVNLQSVELICLGVECNVHGTARLHGEVFVVEVGNSLIIYSDALNYVCDVFAHIYEVDVAVLIFEFRNDFHLVAVFDINIITASTAWSNLFAVQEHSVEHVTIVGRANHKLVFHTGNIRHIHKFAIGKLHNRISVRKHHLHLFCIVDLHLALLGAKF